MTRLRLYYDARCGRQRQLVPIDCAPKPPGQTDLAVLSDSGGVWTSDWSYRLARQAFATLSKNRATLSEWLGLHCAGPQGCSL